MSLFSMMTGTREKRPSKVPVVYKKTVEPEWIEPLVPASNWNPLFEKIAHEVRPPKVTIEQIGEIAASIDVPRANLLALFRKESSSRAFVQHKDGLWRPIVRFELHKVSEFTNHMFADEHPNLFKRKFKITDSNATQEEHYLRMAKVLAIIEGFFGSSPVWEATGWGFGQVQGFNSRYAGFGTVERFVEAMGRSEFDQLKAVATFLQTTGIRDELANGEWEAFARQYNGSARYKEYAVELASHYHVVTGRASA